MADRIHTVHVSPYVSAQGTAAELARMGIHPAPRHCDTCGRIQHAHNCGERDDG